MLLVLAAISSTGDAEAKTRGWCGQARHAEFLRRKFPAQAAELDYSSKKCPMKGKCDDPKVRDAYRIRPLKLRLWVHVFCSSWGDLPDGVDKRRVKEQIAFLSRDLGSYALGVELVNTSFHFDDRYYNVSSDDDDFDDIVLEMKKEYAVQPDKWINVYVMQSPGSLEGFSTLPWESYATGYAGGLWLSAAYFGWGNRTMIHEMGHVAGLLHTFEGSSDGDSCGTPCAELVHAFDDPHADLVGDFCADTPATNENYECADPPKNATDCAGTPFGQTDYENYMSYSDDGCLLSFTDQQLRRAHCWICNSAIKSQVKGCHT